MKRLDLQYPEQEKLLSIIVEYIKDNSLFCWGTNQNEIEEAMSLIISEYHVTGQKVNIRMLYEKIKHIAKSYSMFKYFKACIKKYPSNWTNVFNYESNGDLFGTVLLEEDFNIIDNDCYQTAGGYRKWIVPKGEVAAMYLNKDLSIRIEMIAHCVLDHYNNNFGGISIGNGDTTYKLGERTEMRSINLGREAIDSNWTKKDIKLEKYYIDRNKIREQIFNLIPEFEKLW